MPAPSPAEPGEALDELAAHLSPADYRTAVTAREGKLPCLTVTSRHAVRLGEQIYAGHGWYWWSWAERICPVSEPAVAARKIAAVLRVDAEPSHG